MKPALLLVDLQNDFLNSAGLQPAAEALIAAAAKLLADCRRRNFPVIHIWTTIRRDDDRRLPHWRQSNRWMCVAGTNGHQPPRALQPLDGELIVHKTGFNPFANASLETALRENGCHAVIVAGLHLHACVRTTAVECLERGYAVHVAEDAVATNDPIHAAATRRWLADRCVMFGSADALLGRFEGKISSAFIHRSPRRSDQILFEVPIAGAADVAGATAAAQNAGEHWRRSTLSVREQLLENVAHRLESAATELARQMAVEIGKPVLHGLDEVRRTAGNIRDVIRRAAVQAPLRREAAGSVRDVPLGVIGIISAWNNPVAIPLGKIAPALAYGNTIVWKPAPAATNLAQTILKLLREAGLPPEVVQLVTGDHTTAGLVAADDRVDAVTLTGSLRAGFAIEEISARRIIPFQAELSGNNAAIVWDDCDVERAAGQVAWGAFAFAGQRCTANRRVILPAALVDPFLSKVKAAGEQLPWGDPLEAATEIGPVIDTAKRDEVAARIDAATHNGCAVTRLHERTGGEPWIKAGAYVPPAIVCCDGPEDPLVQEETMGPLLVVQRAEDFDHALTLCNGVRHGLVAALFSGSPVLQKKFLDTARAGVLKLNATTAGVDATLPFGGWKASGVGPPEHGEGDRIFYTRMQAVYGMGPCTPGSAD
jgi:acyl-CoA reductase-like NAD-dependent aldehyde dehydrogenase/nicotinamidase-related amidase